MSLTNLIRKRQDIRDYLCSMIKEPPKMPEIGEGILPKTYNFSEVGAAYDYALRFEILRLYPSAKEEEWIANIGASIIIHNIYHYLQKWKTPALRTLEEARLARTEYYSNPNNTNLRKMVEMCFRLSALDVVYREFKIPLGPVPSDKLMPGPENTDVKDVISLLKGSEEFIRSKRFKESSIIMLNPEFGAYSGVVQGADADIITSTSLIDLKASIHPYIGDYELAQIVGYYLLLQMNLTNPLNVASSQLKEFPSIRELGIFNPRYNICYCIPTESIDLNRDKLSAFINLVNTDPSLEYNQLEKLHKIGYERSRALNNFGIKTVEDLAHAASTMEESNLVKGIHMKKLSAIARDYIDHKFSIKRGISIDWAREKFDFDDEVYLDIETTGLSNDSQIWLIGMLFKKNDKVIQLFAASPEDEKIILKQYLELFRKIKGKIVIFSGHFFDQEFLEARLKRYGISHRSQRSSYVDVLNLIRDTIIIPSNNNLKEMASWMGYRFRHEDLAGDLMPGLYIQYVLTMDQVLKTSLKEYNEDDIRSLKRVVEFIRSGLRMMNNY